jgi:hypothetical protein
VALDDQPLPDRDEHDAYEEEEPLAVERAVPFVVPPIVRSSGRWGSRQKGDTDKPRVLTAAEKKRLEVEGKIDTPRGVITVKRAPFTTGRMACPFCQAPKVHTRAGHFGGGKCCYGCGREVQARG